MTSAAPLHRSNAGAHLRACERDADTLGRRMLLENPSTYLQFPESTMSELDFISEIAKRTGCGLLLDVNNVFVSCKNHNMDAGAYIDAFPVQHVGEIHLAGHASAKMARARRF